MTHKRCIKMFVRFLKANNAYRAYIYLLSQGGTTLRWLLNEDPEEFLMEAFNWDNEDAYDNNTHDLDVKFYCEWFWSNLDDDWRALLAATNFIPTIPLFSFNKPIR